MVFSSLPPYLDPSNWHQPQNHLLIGSTSTSPNPRLPAEAPPAPHGGSIRPGSMSERARLANIAIPEAALKCPRCESTNTKFCYFNNYSLTQPRHFCKTCRRYWTRGGALRNVPVGGGCQRNKRSSKSSSRSKSPANVDRQTPSPSTAPINGAVNISALPPLPRFSSQLTNDNFAGDLGMNYGGINEAASFQSGANNLVDPWRMQQFPILNGLDPLEIYQFHHQAGGELGFIEGEPTRPKHSGTLLTQLAAVKMEENRELNLSRQMLGGMAAPLTDHHWNGNAAAAWTELSGFSSPSMTRNPLQP